MKIAKKVIIYLKTVKSMYLIFNNFINICIINIVAVFLGYNIFIKTVYHFNAIHKQEFY